MNPTFATDPQRALKLYFEVGYHVEPNIFSADECRELIDASHQLPSYREGKFGSVMNPHLVDPVFFRGLAHERVKKTLETIVSGQVSGLQTQMFYGPPGTHGFSMHQDNFFLHAKPDAFVSNWSALEPIGPENGGLIVYPKSHLLPILPVRDLAPVSGMVHDPNSNKMESMLPEGYEKIHLTLEAGSSVFIHANLVHESHKNKTLDRFRHVLLCTYIRSGEGFRPGTYAKRAEIKI